MNKVVKGCCGGIVFIFFIIGFLCLLFGCSPTNPTFCMIYNKYDGIIYNNTIALQKCKGECKRTRSRHCDQWKYYDCYDMTIYVEYEANEKQHNCKKKISNEIMASMDDNIEYYAINNTLGIFNLNNKYPSTCNLNGDVVKNWWIGISFLILCVACIFTAYIGLFDKFIY